MYSHREGRGFLRQRMQFRTIPGGKVFLLTVNIVVVVVWELREDYSNCPHTEWAFVLTVVCCLLMPGTKFNASLLLLLTTVHCTHILLLDGVVVVRGGDTMPRFYIPWGIPQKRGKCNIPKWVLKHICYENMFLFLPINTQCTKNEKKCQVILPIL